MSEKKLLNCPFCGWEAKICDGYIEEFLKTEYMKYVKCNYCKASTKLYFSEEEAIKVWNTRKPMERVLERLNDKLMTAVDCSNIYDNPTYDTIIECYEEAIEIVKECGIE